MGAAPAASPSPAPAKVRVVHEARPSAESASVCWKSGAAPGASTAQRRSAAEKATRAGRAAAGRKRSAEPGTPLQVWPSGEVKMAQGEGCAPGSEDSPQPAATKSRSPDASTP